MAKQICSYVVEELTRDTTSHGTRQNTEHHIMRDTSPATTQHNTCAARGHTQVAATQTNAYHQNRGNPSRPTPTHLERVVKAPQDSLGILEVCLSKSLHHPASSVSHEPDRFNIISVHVKQKTPPPVSGNPEWGILAPKKRKQNRKKNRKGKAADPHTKRAKTNNNEKEKRNKKPGGKKTGKKATACLHRDLAVCY